jgi:hypothetical protein
MKNSKVRRRDGVVYRKEVPSAEIVKDALIYVYDDSPLHGVIHTEYHAAKKKLTGNFPGFGRDSTYLIKQPVPEDIGPWKYKLLTCEPSVLAPFLTPITIDADSVDWLPDIFGNVQAPIVTGRVRETIEEADPGYSYFFPAEILMSGSGAAVPGDRYFWFQRRRMSYVWNPLTQGVGEQLRLPWDGRMFARGGVAWQLTHNAVLRDFVCAFPFWGVNLNQLTFAMSAPAFRRLKAGLFTGMIESTSTDYQSEDRDDSQNIGHF